MPNPIEQATEGETMHIADLLSMEPVTIEPTASIQAAAQLMRERHVGDVVVTANVGGKQTPVGMLTDRDLVVELLAQGVDTESVRVVDIMSTRMVKAHVNMEVDQLIEAMRQHGVRRLPLVDDEGVLVRVVSIDDLIGLTARYMGDLYALVRRERDNEAMAR